MQNTRVLANSSSLKGVSIITVQKAEKDENARGSKKDYFYITFSDGKVMQGDEPYSSLSIYEYDVEFRPMNRAPSLIISATPKRPPLNLPRLTVLARACHVEYDWEEIVFDGAGRFDARGEAPDQTENLKQYYPKLYEELNRHVEGVLFFHFDNVQLLYQIYKMELVRSLSPESLMATASIARERPALLAFKVTSPSKILPEIGEGEFNLLLQATGKVFEVEEKAAIILYNKWLKQDVFQYGNTFSLRQHASKHCIFDTEGMDFLTENKIAFMEGEKIVCLTEVLQWEEMIRKSCETLKGRFSDARGFIPLRGPDDSPYTIPLKVLTQEQDIALRCLLDRAVGILSGKAGSGKTSILAHIVAKYGDGAVFGCAPTNRAARVMTSKVVVSKTIHRMAYDLVTGDESVKPEAIRIVVIDESSMLSLRLFSYALEILVHFCPNLQRIYLIGDIAQLESVEAGKVLSDMAQVFVKAELHENHRVGPEAQIIHENALRVREQDATVTIDPKCFTFSPYTKNLYEDLENVIKTYPDIKEWNTHIISPYREESKNINILAKQFFTNRIYTPGVFHKGDKILCTKNYNSKGLINGDFFKITDILIVQEVHSEGQGPKTTEVKTTTENTSCALSQGEKMILVVVPAAFTGEEAETMDTQTPLLINLSEVPLSSFVLGYCTTNHQFQGCETDNVIFFMGRYNGQDYSGKAGGFVNWKHVYTAITRAKKRVIIIGDENLYKLIVKNRVIERRTLLARHLAEPPEFLKELPQTTDSCEVHMQALVREMVVNDEGADATPFKREREVSEASGDQNKRTRH